MHSKRFLVEAKLEIIPGNLFSVTHLTPPFTTDESLLASHYSIAIQHPQAAYIDANRAHSLRIPTE